MSSPRKWLVQASATCPARVLVRPTPIRLQPDLPKAADTGQPIRMIHPTIVRGRVAPQGPAVRAHPIHVARLHASFQSVSPLTNQEIPKAHSARDSSQNTGLTSATGESSSSQ